MYNHAPENYICPFCALIRGETNSHAFSTQDDIVFHDASVTAIISSHQWAGNHGNVIIAPNEHFENIFELPDRYGAAIQATARRIAIAQKAVYGAVDFPHVSTMSLRATRMCGTIICI